MIIAITNQPVMAQNIESIVMPGPVIEDHADIEHDCSSCHQRFNRSGQSELCADCHEEVSRDINSGSGFHGKSVEVSEQPCAACHTDHEGRNATVVHLDEATFDHLLTDFALLGMHAEATCESCHMPATRRREAPGECIDCHTEDNIHEESLGTNCSGCHNESAWTDVQFDHGQTDYPLTGKHVEVACGDCHEDRSFRFTPTTCIGCHADDDVHNGRSGDRCENCHSTVSWQDSSFDHSRDTEFDLLGSHAELTCADCHSADPFSDKLDTQCVGCHFEDDDHDGHHGSACGACHDSTAWPDVHFSHDADTSFALVGAHESVACNDCHTAPVYDASPGTACVSCHQDDEPHGGKQGDQCANCHTETTWLEAPLFSHDLTAFPLLGEHSNRECNDCHESRVFAGTNSNCIDCHVEDDAHDGRFAENCESCHNPVAWDLWLFDHNTQTSFRLDGAHATATCDGCHRGPLEKMSHLRTSCSDCHRADDVHDGEFGFDCGRCHSQSAFTDVKELR